MKRTRCRSLVPPDQLSPDDNGDVRGLYLSLSLSLSLSREGVSNAVTLARPSVSPTALSDMHHLTCGINSLLHSINLIVFTLIPVHLILRISPHYSHHLRSHHLSLPPPFTPDLKRISFRNPFLHSHSYYFRTAFTGLEPVLN